MTNVLQAAQSARAKHVAEIERIDSFIATYHELVGDEPQPKAEQPGEGSQSISASTVAVPMEPGAHSKRIVTSISEITDGLDGDVDPKPDQKPKHSPSAFPTPNRVAQTKPVAKPKGARFYLRQQLGKGKFLHFTCMSLTDDRDYAWVGSEKQLLACRKSFSLAADLTEEVAE